MTAISVAFVVVVATAAWMWVLNRRRQHSLFARLGIPGPAPDLFSGNWVQLKKDPLEVSVQTMVPRFPPDDLIKVACFGAQITELLACSSKRLIEPAAHTTLKPFAHLGFFFGNQE